MLTQYQPQRPHPCTCVTPKQRMTFVKGLPPVLTNFCSVCGGTIPPEKLPKYEPPKQFPVKKGKKRAS